MTRAAFAQGYTDGVLLGQRTAREAMTDYPDYTPAQVDAYCNGTEDGARGDTWRLDRLAEQASGVGVTHVTAWAARYFHERDEALAFVDWFVGFSREHPDVAARRSYPELLPLYERRAA